MHCTRSLGILRLVRPALLALAPLLAACSSTPPPPPPRTARKEQAQRALLEGEIELALAVARHGLPSPTPELDALASVASGTTPELGLGELLDDALEEPAAARIKAGDEIEILVVGRPEFSDTLRVERDGTIELLHLGAIEVSERTPAEISSLLEQATKRYVREPEIRVRQVQGVPRTVRVLGQVRAHKNEDQRISTLALPSDRRLSVYELLTRVQGLERDADADHLLLLRRLPPSDPTQPSSSERVSSLSRGLRQVSGSFTGSRTGAPPPATPLGQVCFHFSYEELVRARLEGREAWLHPDDELVVPRLRYAFALGKVPSPGRFPLQRGLTLAGLALQAGGFPDEADRGGVVLLRQGKVLSPSLDESAQPGDVLYVPEAKRIYTIGAGVARRGPVRLPPGGLTVLEAIAEAGWFTFDADLDSVQLLRTQGGSQKRMRLPVEEMLSGEVDSTDYPLEPGDTILVPEVGW